MIDSNIANLAVRMRTKPAKIRKGVTNGLDETSKVAVRSMKQFIQPHSKSGRLLKSVKSVKTGEFSRAIGPYLNEKYPLYLEKGRGPIYPKLQGMPLRHSVALKGVHIGASALRFTIGGKTIFRKSVGPAKARPYVKPTHDTLKFMYPKIMEHEINNALK